MRVSMSNPAGLGSTALAASSLAIVVITSAALYGSTLPVIIPRPSAQVSENKTLSGNLPLASTKISHHIATMMFVDVLKRGETPGAADLSEAVRNRRLGLNLSQEDLAKASGVPLSTLKKFERTGQISLASFLALCDAIAVGHRLNDVIPPAPPSTLDEVEGRTPRKARKRASPRGRRP